MVLWAAPVSWSNSRERHDDLSVEANKIDALFSTAFGSDLKLEFGLYTVSVH